MCIIKLLVLYISNFIKSQSDSNRAMIDWVESYLIEEIVCTAPSKLPCQNTKLEVLFYFLLYVVTASEVAPSKELVETSISKLNVHLTF